MIQICDRQSTLRLPVAKIRKLARLILAQEGRPGATISLAFVGNREIHAVNRTFLKHDYATDVLSFPLGDDGDGVFGELVISTEYAAGEARARGISVEEETLRYVAHGLLHLFGYDDHAPARRRAMWKKQEAYLTAVLGSR